MQAVMEEAVTAVSAMNEKLHVVESLTRHDIRNKLTSLNARAYLLEKRLNDNADALAQVKAIEAASKQILEILEFEHFYVQVGSEELQFVDVEKYVNQATSLFSDLNGAKILNRCHGLTVLADSRLRQLFSNLLDNTLKYGEKVTAIDVHFTEEKDHLKIIYEDNGVDVDDKMRSRLFTEGFGKGTGYGLT
jgi:signal transduction histidine kinase